MNEPPQAILELIEKCGRNTDEYRNPKYNETLIRVEFVNPLFRALGWDVENTDGYAFAYRDVIHEDEVKVAGVTKAPDYCFRVGGTRKFFVETKKPAVKLRIDPAPAFQLRRYGYSAGLPISILTDFEEFIVYDCRTKPLVTDKASVARIRYYNFREYAEKWSEISAVFHREAILRGSLDRYAEDSTGKRGTAELDGDFLDDLDQWRLLLARNLALRNAALSSRELNTAVQLTIDRLLFLRMCEERGIEQFGQLQSLLSGTRCYPRLVEIYRRADERYNSGLFHFSSHKDDSSDPDCLTPSLAVDDKVVRTMVGNLYYPECPYEFSMLPVEVLGNAYEQYLGKTIRLTPGHHAKLEEKPEVQKAGGVYYTPEYVVRYIVGISIGGLLDGMNPRQVPDVRILDPACGSGSFLLGAYQFLLDWHLEWYYREMTRTGDIPISPPTKGKRKRKSDPQVMFQSTRGEWLLTTREKKRILLNNIYGVDIDEQAVEVTKLSLLLKVLESENQDTLSRQLTLWRERALPDLADNIRCGNSLVCPDYFEGRLSFEESELRRVNAFEWEEEFGDVMVRGGFDAVIGNPPWGGDIDQDLTYFRRRFPQSTKDHTDSFKLFVQRAIELTRPGGVVSMITPQAVIRQRRCRDIRALLLDGTINEVVDLGDGVFRGVVAPAAAFSVYPKSVSKGDYTWTFLELRHLSDNVAKQAALATQDRAEREVSLSSVRSSPDLDLAAVESGTSREHVVLLGDFPGVRCKDAGINYQRVGVGMREKGKSDLGQRLLYEGVQEQPSHPMFWKGADIDRYWVAPATSRFCRPECRATLRRNEVVRLAEDVYGTTPKILVRQTADKPIATVDERGVWFGRSVLSIIPTAALTCSIHYLLGVLNSRFLRYKYFQLAAEKGRVFAQVKFSKLKQLPMRVIDFEDAADAAFHERMVVLVRRMLTLTAQVRGASLAPDRTLYQRQLAATDREIDRLVYEFYGLGEAEIATVEEATR